MAGNETPKTAPAATPAPAAQASVKGTAAPQQSGVAAAAQASLQAVAPAKGVAAAAAAPAGAAAEAPAGPSKAAVAAEKAKAAAEKAKQALSKFKSLGALANAKELIADLADPHPGTRKMARYFVLSVVGVIGVLVATGIYISQTRMDKQLASGLTDTGEQGKNLGDFIKKQAEDAKRKFSSQTLGSFTIELKGPEDKDPKGKEAKRPPGVMNLAEVEIIVECDEKETCDFIEDRMPAVRNQLTSVFTAIEREELMSREGKRKLKMRIMSKLNLWLPNGKIENLYFNKLVIS